MKNTSKVGLLLLGGVACAITAQAQPDYPLANWVSAYRNHWYTTGYGHKFCVIHDMEGYYMTCLSYFQLKSTSASSHYIVNGKKDTTSDAAPGQVTQMVREAYYAWHALCWNKYCFGTEHEGFVSNPAWFTYEMYNATAGLHRHLCDTWNIAKDRNHVVGHDEKKNAAWVSWVNATSGWGIDPTCNTHTDPGAYWDWSLLMSMINNTPANRAQAISASAPASVTAGATFNATVTFRNIGNTTWAPGAYFLGSQNPQDNTRWGFNRVSIAGNVAPGATNVVTFQCTAPTAPAIYPFEWKMLQEGVEWFGGTASASINVGNAQPVPDIIIDNTAATVTGSWSTATSSTDKYGADYRYKSPGTGGSYLQYTPSIGTAGNYNVYEWHPQGSNRTTNAPVVISYNGGTQTAYVNQKINGGTWVFLGMYNFVQGSAGNIKIQDNCSDTGTVIMADAIKLVYVP